RASWAGLHLAQLIVLTVCTYSRVFFRADSAEQGWMISLELFNFAEVLRTAPQVLAGIPMTACLVAAMIVVRHAYMQIGARRVLERRLPMELLRIPAASLLFAVAWFFRGPIQEFYYFQF